MQSRLEKLRINLTPEDRAEIAARAKRLKALEDLTVERGRPRKFFDMSLEFMAVLMKSFTEPLNFTFGYNNGLHFDGHCAWRAFVRLAYSKGHYWVGAQRSHGDSTGVVSFPCPVHRDDVEHALARLAPGVPFRWSPSSCSEMFAHPWSTRVMLVTPRTFFGMDVNRDRVYVGSSEVPTDRCNHLHVKLIGLSAMPLEIVHGRLHFTHLKKNWYRANPLTLKRIAEMSSDHLKGVYLKEPLA